MLPVIKAVEVRLLTVTEFAKVFCPEKVWLDLRKAVSVNVAWEYVPSL